MEEYGMDVAKRQRLDSYGGRPGPPHAQQQHPDHPAPLPLHGAHHRAPLAPPNAYRQAPPHSPYQHPPSSSGTEPPPPGAYPPSQSEGELSRNPRSAPADQTSFPRTGSISAGRSPKSAHAPRPLNTSFEGEHSPYPPHSSADIDPYNSAPPSAGPGGHYGPTHYEGHQSHPGHPPPAGMGGHYSEAEMHSGGMSYQTHSYNASPHPASATWSTHYPPVPIRRHNRAQQACDTCRQRKVKCDEGKPKCQYCRDNEQACVYKEVQPPKADRAQKEIIDGQESIRVELGDLRAEMSELGDLRAEMNELKTLLRGLRQMPPPQLTPSIEAIPNVPAPALERKSSSHQTDPRRAGGDAQAKQTSLEVDQAVGVHRLLRWPTIKALLSHPQILQLFGVSHIDALTENFVMQSERKKGMLRVYGRGQGPDTYEGSGSNLSTPGTPTNMDDTPVGGSPGASPPEVWGGGPGVPNMPTPEYRFANNTNDNHPGGLNPDGSLKMDATTMEALHRSYIDNLHILHPFLSRMRLRRMFDRVRIQSNPSERERGSASSRKRKLDGSPMDESGSDNAQLRDQPFLEQRVSTAIVLMVMALGKICLASKPLCGPVQDYQSDSANGGSPFSQGSPNIKPSPMRVTSPSNSSVTSEYRSNAAIARIRAQYDTTPTSTPRRDDRNIDVIPGLAYYAKGAEILGTLQGGNSLAHVQAMLLASLYCGQLASSIEAWSWLSQAGRACLFLMQDHPFEAERKRDPVRVELIYFAYWTCYQFEGDILAELDLQPSGIEDMHNKREDGIRFPKLSSEDVVNHQHQDRMMRYYSFQIHLRKTLNEVQQYMYPPDAYLRQRTVDELLFDRYNCRLAMQGWREALLVDMRWADDDHLTPDILEARLRAKYYGTLYVINRPMLEYALHRIKKVVTAEIRDGVQAYRNAAPTLAKDIVDERSDMEIYRACVDCVEAARRSTTAFDGIIFDGADLKNRLIVTNIVGTAHAQFGNMLILSATYKSRLGFMIDRGDLGRLLERTIKFLRSHSPISYTLGKDAEILQGILDNIDMRAREPTSSFSSNS